MSDLQKSVRAFTADVTPLATSETTREESYYPAVRNLLVAILKHLGQSTGDLYLNDRVFFRNVPEDVWRYELGGYPVLKKWLDNRDARRRDNRPLLLSEKEYFRAMVHRIAALLSLRQRLNELYERASTDAWTADGGETAGGGTT